MPLGGHVRPARGERIVLWTAMLLLMWGCYANGAFLLPVKTMFAVTACAVGLVWVLLFLVRRPRSVAILQEVRAPEWLLLGLASVGALSAVWSLSPADSLRASGVLFGGLVFLRLGCQLPRLSPGSVPGVLFLVAEVGAILSLVSCISWLLGLPLFTQQLDGSLLVVGTFGYANAFAAFLLLSLASTAAFFSWLERRGPEDTSGIDRLAAGHRRFYLLAMTIPQLAALVLTRANAAMAIAGFLFLLLLVQRLGAAKASRGLRRLRYALVALGFLAVVGGGLLVWRDVAPQMAVSGLPEVAIDQQTGEQLPPEVPMTSSAYRVKTWIAAIQAVGERPWLGYGLGTFLPAYAPYKLGAHTAYAHNFIVQQLVELGVLGCVLLVAFLVWLFAGPVKTLRNPAHNPRVPLLLGTLAFALHNLVDLSWYFPALLMLFMLVSGILLSWRPLSPESA